MAPVHGRERDVSTGFRVADEQTRRTNLVAVEQFRRKVLENPFELQGKKLLFILDEQGESESENGLDSFGEDYRGRRDEVSFECRRGRKRDVRLTDVKDSVDKSQRESIREQGEKPLRAVHRGLDARSDEVDVKEREELLDETVELEAKVDKGII